ncbi:MULTISPECIES: DNA translocase FtsK [Campylobacter]|uniref:DNA translocase FtsK 4TM domain-containing protein n=1 Tax=Campylobacter vicugnae TaxID=1660076 RepID=A0ABZ2E5R2_9BACT|nr:MULTISPECIES: DNA translocase FtsK [unclassified Campylobacter]ARR04102.1 DNA segregation ATPase FtsK/SpoIIIE [Campylobacter sp. RM12175]MCR8690225.1 DNA translocase FtsK [Campylobacter sp. RM9264]MCR8700670.1 DNA translocase FtsK [Campylobacter sp. RM12176]
MLVYLGVATIVPYASFVGSYGGVLGWYNVRLFGYASYFYPFILLYPVYNLYKSYTKFSLKVAGNIIGSLMLFYSFLLFCSMFDPMAGGVVGGFSSEALRSVIGSAGTFIFILMIFFIACGLTFDDRLDVMVKKAFVVKSKIELEAKPKAKEVEPTKLEQSKSKPQMLDSNDDVASLEINLETSKNENLENEPNILNDELNINEPKEPKSTSSGAIILSEVAENKELLNQIEKGKVEKPKDFKLPSLDFLKDPPKRSKSINEAEIDQKIADLLDKLKRFKIDGDVVRTYSGPVVTTFEFKPAAHVKVSKILTLQDDLAMALKAQTIRIQAPIPGKDVVGIEIPNKNIETIYLKEILESDIYKNAKSELTLALGKDIVGDPFITDLKKLPHLLIAGTTGSGKSVGINAMVLSLLYRNSPKTLRLIMIDPKMLEFSMYNDIPHLLTPVITEPKKAIAVLANLVAEMERRYRIMSQTRTKNIESYNEKMKKDGGETLPFIVVIIDELADLMMTSGKEVEFHIGRLAQMARASGIHLIVATQRPSVDVVTGLIKANLPSRISYRVGQKVDSKVILDQMGAESLLGRGDMLFTPPGSPGIVRLHAPFASEEEIDHIAEFLKAQESVVYENSFLKDDSVSSSGGVGEFSGEIDELYDEAKSIVLSEEKTSISYLQRRLKVGYNRAASIIEQLEQNGVLTPPNSKGQRDIIR